MPRSKPPPVVEVLARLGGVATRGTLLRQVKRAALARAVGSGDVVRLARGRYTLPQVASSMQDAVRVGGALSLTSAALHYGWEVKHVPRRTQVCVPKWRRVPTTAEVEINRANLSSHQVEGGVTDVETTLTQCLRMLPFDEALTVADSALRHGVPRSMLDRVAEQAAGPGAPQMRRVAREATAEAANPFESVLRAIALDVPGLRVEAQVWVDAVTRPDLVDERLRLVLEAESFGWHGNRVALTRDARRYNRLVVQGWIVLRFAWEDVMGDPGGVAQVLREAVAMAELLTEVRLRSKKTAKRGTSVRGSAAMG